ncbi:MAG TPA: hypothetical protein VG122_05725 [Gemmata sp.]|jgi:hypothetical protein|nr:hypothetical protein [Gemmata sp.]
MSEASANSLFRCTVKVRPGPGCDMPAHLRGAMVDCYVSASEYLGALRLAVEKLKSQGFGFEDLVDGKVHQLDPLKWEEFVLSTWPEFPDYFPPQADILRFVEAGGVFFGPFCGWESET